MDPINLLYKQKYVMRIISFTQPLDGLNLRLGMDIVIGSWQKNHNSNRSGGSKYDPIVSFIGGLQGFAGGSPPTDLSLVSRDLF